jgi:hypothetical protein
VFNLAPALMIVFLQLARCCFDITIVIAMQFEMMEPKLCQIVCKIVLSEEEAKDFMEKIEDEYRRVNM